MEKHWLFILTKEGFHVINVLPAALSECPDSLRSAVQKRLEEEGCELLSVSVTESMPYQDKRMISRQYRVILNRLNLVSVLHCRDDGALKDKVFTNELIWGDVLEIIRTAPVDSSLAMLRQAIPEETKKLLSL